MCQSNSPDVSLPAYPKPPQNETQQSMTAFAKQQEAWAVKAIGAFTVEKAARANTRKCLKNLHKQGVIN